MTLRMAWPEEDAGGAPELEASTPPLVGRSAAFRATLERARALAIRPGVPVLLVGEAGTGKASLARLIHELGPGRDDPLLTLDCGGLPPDALERELFGEGERTGLLELAGTGTVVLRGLTAFPSLLQPRLLRAVNDRRFRRRGTVEEVVVRSRVVATAGARLDQEAMAGRLREDLHACLAGGRIDVPPLRDRDGDVALLARHFARERAVREGLEPVTLSDDAVEALEAHGWPGNVRELRDVVESGVRAAAEGEVTAGHLTHQDRRRVPLGEEGPAGEGPARIEIPEAGRALEEIEAEAVRLTLELTGGNKSRAARMLRVSRPTLHRKLEGRGRPSSPGRPSGGEGS